MTAFPELQPLLTSFNASYASRGAPRSERSRGARPYFANFGILRTPQRHFALLRLCVRASASSGSRCAQLGTHLPS